MKKLYESDHPYYCSNQTHAKKFSSWSDFIEEEGDADLCMNLLFRWDWKDFSGWSFRDKEFKILEDQYYRGYELHLYYVGQRKGLFRSISVEVCLADEPAIREWLQIRYDHMQKIWEPFGNE